ncbi:MAG: 2,3-diphosphoglycerate-dependent phosphoglycerate mutase [Bacilli bacterium]|jgi:2,3-bisphosphoglycerate-dependent phosphoglycerate mutase|nr:2,3-diphosphoglycerate-dependent phosphoglycerate mutase [Bacilli bacterium]
MYKIVLVRHGESEWNKLNLFTGWTDVGLSGTGVNEAKSAGAVLKANGYRFDVCYTSFLKRAIHTEEYILDALDENWIPVIKSWKLNERHYGALQGLNKAETAAKYGESQVQIWRRSFDVRPPELDHQAAEALHLLPQYQNVPYDELPHGESLKDTIARVVPYFETEIKPQIVSEKNVIIVAHGNSLRALVKYFEKLSDDEIAAVNIPTGTPLVYELDFNFTVLKKYYLGDEKAVAEKEKAVANQGKKI